MPEGGVEWIPHEKILSYENLFFLIEYLQKVGVKKVRFTGGEPLVRKGMIPFLEKICASFPKLEIALTTNGSTLAQYALPLAHMGLSSLNVSLDTLDAEKFAFMTRGGSLQTILDGLDMLTAVLKTRIDPPMQVKINTVLVRGFNDDSVKEMADFAFRRGIILRFIEYMPLDKRVWSEREFVPFTEALNRLSSGASSWREEKLGKETAPGPASYYVNTATGQYVGVISAVSKHFCTSCNRLRISSTGEVRPCLFGDRKFSIFDALRNRDEEALLVLFNQVVFLKPALGTILLRKRESMHKIGG
jgi:cyclic pyranopterin phosphate synthase